MQSNLLDLITIDRRSTIEYDTQLKESIKALILDQTFYYNTALPSELELAKHLNIDKKVVVSTYQQLTDERYIKKDSAGVFKISFFELTNYFFDRNVTVYDAIISLNLKPSIKCITEKVIDLDEGTIIKMGFDVNQSHKYLYIYRIYMGDNQPIMVLENYLPLYIFKDIEKIFVGDEPLDDFLGKQYGINAKVSKRIMKSVNLPQEIANYLNVRKNAASIQSTNHIYDKFGRLIDYGRSHTITSYYFQALIKREEMQENYPEIFK